MKILAIVFLLIGTACLAFCIRNFFILWGYRKVNTKKVNAYLQNTIHEKDVYKGGKTGRFYKHWTESVYVYRVEGKPYIISTSFSGRPSEMMKIIKVIYQISNPERAYFEGIFPMEWIYGILCAIGAVIALILGVIGFFA